VITSKNSVTSVLFLISIYLLTSIFFLILGAEFLAILLLIVYVGAVSILFIFVVMMLNLRVTEVYNTLMNYLPIGSFIGFFFLAEMLYMIKSDLNFFVVYNNDILIN
jgi:NADH-quinone oxidoreductase subunit J